MDKAELNRRLTDHGVPWQTFSLDGLRDGECYCILRDNAHWKVVFNDRGKVTDLATGLSEQEAYEFLYKELRGLYGWKD